MPKVNRPRKIGAEATLAARIKYEREDKRMSPAGLAARMELAGCPINTSAIYRLENPNADPPRRITVDELIAFGEVFGLPPEELLKPAAVVKHDKLRRGLDELSERFFELRGAQRDYDATVARLMALADELGYALEIPAPTASAVTEGTPWVVGISERG